jgi:hypothetical protein
VNHLEHPGDDPGAVDRVASVGDDKLHVELGRLQQVRQFPGVVDITPDVGVENDGDFRRGRGLLVGRFGRRHSSSNERQGQDDEAR